MKKELQKPVWIVDDDLEDHELIMDIFKELEWPHQLELFQTGEQLLEKLHQANEGPFIIISDVYLPKMSGFELRQKMLNNPNNKFHSVPFIFWSTFASERQIRKAFDLNVHGFFLKESSFSKWKEVLIKIIGYWTVSMVPSRKDNEEEVKLVL